MKVSLRVLFVFLLVAFVLVAFVPAYFAGLENPLLTAASFKENHNVIYERKHFDTDRFAKVQDGIGQLQSSIQELAEVVQKPGAFPSNPVQQSFHMSIPQPSAPTTTPIPEAGPNTVHTVQETEGLPPELSAASIEDKSARVSKQTPMQSLPPYTDIFGADLIDIDEVDAAKCQKLCTERADCSAFVFTTRCFLKSWPLHLEAALVYNEIAITRSGYKVTVENAELSSKPEVPKETQAQLKSSSHQLPPPPFSPYSQDVTPSYLPGPSGDAFIYADDITHRWEACADEDFGDGLLKRWRGKAKEVCGQNGVSKIIEHELRQARHMGEDYAFMAQNSVFYPQEGRFTIDCQSIGGFGARQRKYSPQKDLKTWLNSIRFAPVSGGTSVDWDTTVTIFAIRDCNPPPNPFHCVADVVNAFMALDFYGIKRENTRVLFLDDIDETIFGPIWSHIGGAGVYTKKVWKQWKDPLYLETAIINIPHGSSFIWKDGWEASPCPHMSPILHRFGRLAASAYLSQQEMTSFLEGSQKAQKIVIASRRGAKWRRMLNENALVDALSSQLSVQIEAVDFGSLSYREQVMTVNSATLFIGLHGAALTATLFVVNPLQFSLLEIFTGAEHAFYYNNFALWIGAKSYDSWIYQGPKLEASDINVDIQAIVQKVSNML